MGCREIDIEMENWQWMMIHNTLRLDDNDSYDVVNDDDDDGDDDGGDDDDVDDGDGDDGNDDDDEKETRKN